jgi:hypothetical protein
MFKSSAQARLVGEIGRRQRWARSTPEERSATMARVREGQRAKYLERARQTSGGDQLSERELEYRARQLRLADLAHYRLLAWEAAQTRKAQAAQS